ncbi:ammonium transporter, partial [Escherichia coli]
VWGVDGCLLTGVFTSATLGGLGYAEGVTMLKQVGVQAFSILICVIWTAIVAYLAFLIADKLTGLRVEVEQEREGLDITYHGESAYN